MVVDSNGVFAGFGFRGQAELLIGHFKNRRTVGWFEVSAVLIANLWFSVQEVEDDEFSI